MVIKTGEFDDVAVAALVVYGSGACEAPDAERVSQNCRGAAALLFEAFVLLTFLRLRIVVYEEEGNVLAQSKPLKLPRRSGHGGVIVHAPGTLRIPGQEMSKGVQNYQVRFMLGDYLPQPCVAVLLIEGVFLFGKILNAHDSELREI